uniref:Uncharacterized protein n=1 Tax=Globisporangium ultimum (strain ATCC 200006 / CBS 805.95 / DAOM BR144) TaxID=431595 RepID=K3WTZ7_GLOUD
MATVVACECERIAADRDLRVAKWRALCEQFYFRQDGAAKRVLDYFESSKLDQIIIEADTAAVETADERVFTELITFLGLRKCVQREDHAHFFHETIEALERVKDEVRKSYHAHRAKSQYDEFDGHVRGMQSTNYEVKQDPDGQQRLAVRVQEGYLRTHSNQLQMEKSTEAFIKANVSNIGAHPFLAGLAEVLRWNLESTTVIGWRLSDAVFIESGGPAFAGAALNFLVGVLNFGHFVIDDAASADPNAEAVVVKSRVWFLDPYLSDNYIRQLLRVFPPSRKLEGRPTGSKHNSELYRMNIHGKHDEHQRFFERWCVML